MDTVHELISIVKLTWFPSSSFRFLFSVLPHPQCSKKDMKTFQKLDLFI